MDAEARREELVGEVERSFGPILFALVLSLPLGLAFVALWGDFRLARTVAAVVSWSGYGLVLYGLATLVIRRIGRLPQLSGAWGILVGVGALTAVRGAFQPGPGPLDGALLAGPLAAAITLVMGLAVEAARRLGRRRRSAPGAQPG